MHAAHSSRFSVAVMPLRSRGQVWIHRIYSSPPETPSGFHLPLLCPIAAGEGSCPLVKANASTLALDHLPFKKRACTFSQFFMVMSLVQVFNSSHLVDYCKQVLTYLLPSSFSSNPFYAL